MTMAVSKYTSKECKYITGISYLSSKDNYKILKRTCMKEIKPQFSPLSIISIKLDIRYVGFSYLLFLSYLALTLEILFIN